MQIVRSLALIGDIQCGSEYAIWPDPINDAQVKLLSYWKRFWATCDDEGVDTIIVNGEFIDGPNVQEYGRGLVTPNITQQKKAAIELIEPYIKDREVIVLAGTDYHNFSITSNADEEIAIHLNAIYPGHIKYKGVMCNVNFPPSQLIFNIAHDISSPVVYKVSALNKEMVFAYEAEALKLLPVERYDVIIRGHLHDYFYINDRRGHGLMMPCWKCFYPIKNRVRYHTRHISAIGGVIIHILEDDTLIIKKQLYPTPHVIGNLEIVENRKVV